MQRYIIKLDSSTYFRSLRRNIICGCENTIDAKLFPTREAAESMVARLHAIDLRHIRTASRPRIVAA